MGTRSPLSLERDEIEIARIEEYFGNVPVQDLDAATISRAYAKMRKTGMSSSALHKTHQKLSQMMKQAVREEIILRNPCDPIDDMKRPEAAERRSLSAEQAVQLAMDLKECERSGRIVAVWLALATGVRRGEALGLVWGNVDLTRKRIRIEKQLDSKGVRRDPKSHKSKRNLAIDDGTVAFLTEWKAMQSDLIYRGGDAPDGAPVCSNDTDGGFISPAAFDKWRRTWFVDHGLGTFEKVETWHDRNGFKRYRRSGYRGYNLHELRRRHQDGAEPTWPLKRQPHHEHLRPRHRAERPRGRRHHRKRAGAVKPADILTLQLPSLKGLASH
ncbi:MAG: tyrosine-type recombinase/integrase [Eggerthellaceae bacterium]|nr:tyrosine-type recombinase/integrase [Eggerthellaceae bacterium]